MRAKNKMDNKLFKEYEDLVPQKILDDVKGGLPDKISDTKVKNNNFTCMIRLPRWSKPTAIISFMSFT